MHASKEKVDFETKIRLLKFESLLQMKKLHDFDFRIFLFQPVTCINLLCNILHFCIWVGSDKTNKMT